MPYYQECSWPCGGYAVLMKITEIVGILQRTGKHSHLPTVLSRSTKSDVQTPPSGWYDRWWTVTSLHNVKGKDAECSRQTCSRVQGWYVRLWPGKSIFILQFVKQLLFVCFFPNVRQWFGIFTCCWHVELPYPVESGKCYMGRHLSVMNKPAWYA